MGIGRFNDALLELAEYNASGRPIPVAERLTRVRRMYYPIRQYIGGNDDTSYKLDDINDVLLRGGIGLELRCIFSCMDSATDIELNVVHRNVPRDAEVGRKLLSIICGGFATMVGFDETDCERFRKLFTMAYNWNFPKFRQELNMPLYTVDEINKLMERRKIKYWVHKFVDTEGGCDGYRIVEVNWDDE